MDRIEDLRDVVEEVSVFLGAETMFADRVGVGSRESSSFALEQATTCATVNEGTTRSLCDSWPGTALEPTTRTENREPRILRLL